MLIEQLDEVLEYLYASEGASLIELEKEFKNTFLNQILQKLIRENFVYIKKEPLVNKLGFVNLIIDIYCISFEGMLLFEAGGYKQKLTNENAENARIDKLEESQQKTQSYLFWLTVLVSVSSAVQAIYNFVELYWKYGWFRF
jgi:hypothetical protein